jgi:hypothetical protein
MVDCFSISNKMRAYIRQGGVNINISAYCICSHRNEIRWDFENHMVKYGWYAIKKNPESGYTSKNCVLVCSMCYRRLLNKMG